MSEETKSRGISGQNIKFTARQQAEARGLKKGLLSIVKFTYVDGIEGEEVLAYGDTPEDLHDLCQQLRSEGVTFAIEPTLYEEDLDNTEIANPETRVPAKALTAEDKNVIAKQKKLS